MKKHQNNNREHMSEDSEHDSDFKSMKKHNVK